MFDLYMYNFNFVKTNMKFIFIAITPSSTLTQSGKTC